MKVSIQDLGRMEAQESGFGAAFYWGGGFAKRPSGYCPHKARGSEVEIQGLLGGERLGNSPLV